MLINTENLSKHLGDPAWVIFDCRHDLFDLAKGECLYREGHIPGAHYANVDTDLSGDKSGTNGRHPLPSPTAFTAFLARNGVSTDSTVVAYDDVGGQFAARLWWMARWIGMTNVSLLDGGIQKWLAEGRTLSTAVPAPAPSPLRDYETIINLIAHTTTAKGLKVTCKLDRRKYPTGRKVSDEEMIVS